jgi:hypothetical protein
MMKGITKSRHEASVLSHWRDPGIPPADLWSGSALQIPSHLFHSSSIINLFQASSGEWTVLSFASFRHNATATFM